MKLLEHFHKLSIYPKNAKELKGLILQLAVKGKLTTEWRKNNPEVESASVLLERIIEYNSEQLILKKRKVKKTIIEYRMCELVKDGCPKCKTDNIHFNYDYTKKELPVERIYCNECDWFIDFDNI